MTIKLNSTTLNVLRVYATLMVFFCHSTIVAQDVFGFKLHGAFCALNTPAWGGVWMFFAMGGFLAAYGFDKKSYVCDKKGIIKYYKTRFVKVLLPTWIFISLAYIFSMNESTLSLKTIIQFMTCTFNGGGAGVKNIGASWYVFITMWLYLLAPIIYKLLRWYEQKNIGNERKSYFILICLISFISILYKVLGGAFLNLDYYTWMYANVLGSIDIFIIGMICCRLLNYLPTNVSPKSIRLLRAIAVITLLMLSTVFSGWIKEFVFVSPVFDIVQKGFYLIYYKAGAIVFSLTALLIVILYSYQIEDKRHKKRLLRESIASICNSVSPYTFMFYLWHSILLFKVAEKLIIDSINIHYITMIIIGFIVTSYIAYLMTNMNNGIIKNILKK